MKEQCKSALVACPFKEVGCKHKVRSQIFWLLSLFWLEYAPAALLDADFGRNQHPAKLGTMLFDCHADLRLQKQGKKKSFVLHPVNHHMQDTVAGAVSRIKNIRLDCKYTVSE